MLPPVCSSSCSAAQPSRAVAGRTGGHRVVAAFANDDGEKPSGTSQIWRTFAVFSGASLQVAANIIVFGYLGYRMGLHWRLPWLTVVGVFVGFTVGATGLGFIIKRLLGERP